MTPPTATVTTALDPFALVRPELRRVERILRDELQSPAPYVDQLLRYVAELNGKRLRPALVLLVAQACGEVAQEHRVTAAVMEMIHLATLVHDDVLDNAEMRRHQQAVHRIWGSQASILLGDHLFSRAFHLASTLGDTFACRTIGASTNRVCEGELVQLGFQGSLETTEAHYLEIIKAKTAELCACCCLLGAHYAGADADRCRDMRDFGYQFGHGFQIVDDILDVVGDPAKMGKHVGTDFKARQLTLPVIHFMHQTGPLTPGDRMQSLQRVRDHRELEKLLCESGSIDYARRCATEYSEQASRILQALPATAARDALAALCGLMLQRIH